MGRPHRRLTASPPPAFTDPAHHPAAATEAPRLQVRRLPLALGTLACTGAVLSLPVPAQALSLGDIVIESALGQPLRAHVPVQLAPGETAGPDCVISSRQESVAPGRLPDTKLHFGDAAGGLVDLRITTAQPVYEPMYEIDLSLRCPGSLMIVRQYVLLLDLPGDTAPASFISVGTTAPAVMPTPATASTEDKAYPAPMLAPQPVRARARPSAPLAAGSLYRVQSGDTLSTIAARIRDRQGLSIWQIAERIFAGNPQAFIGANPDRIRLGAEIVLPAPVETAQPQGSAPVSEVALSVMPTAVAAPDPAASEHPVAEPMAADIPVAPTLVETPPAAAESPATATARQQATPVDSRPQKSATEVAPGHTAEHSDGHEAPAWQAILLGALIGVLASLVLLRERLREMLSTRRWSRPKTRSPQISAMKPAAASPPLPVTTRQAREPSMVVEESPRAAPINESGAGKEAEFAFHLNTPSLRTVDEQKASNTLQEVLELLESDYEQELTSSQIIDRSRFSVNADELDGENEDETLIRAGSSRAVRARG